MKSTKLILENVEQFQAFAGKLSENSLNTKGQPRISLGQSLHAISASMGYGNWASLKSAIEKTAEGKDNQWAPQNWGFPVGTLGLEKAVELAIEENKEALYQEEKPTWGIAFTDVTVTQGEKTLEKIHVCVGYDTENFTMQEVAAEAERIARIEYKSKEEPLTFNADDIRGGELEVVLCVSTEEDYEDLPSEDRRVPRSYRANLISGFTDIAGDVIDAFHKSVPISNPDCFNIDVRTINREHDLFESADFDPYTSQAIVRWD